MRIRLYKITTYAQLDTWSRGTKQSQTKPILPDLPLPAKQKTSLTSSLTRNYANTPQTQKQSQTNPISPPGAKKLLDDRKQKRKKFGAPAREAADTLSRYISTNQGPMPYHVFGTKGDDTASGAAKRASNNMGRRRLQGSAIIWSRLGSAAALPLRLCWLNNNCDQLCLQKPPTIRTCTPALCWMYLALQPGMHFANIARLQSVRALLFLCARFRATRCLTHLHPS